jgi:hypothetical protein
VILDGCQFGERALFQHAVLTKVTIGCDCTSVDAYAFTECGALRS